MITLEKIRLFDRFEGDIDGWARSTGNNNSTMSDEDWHQIDSLIQDIVMIEKGKTSIEFTNNVKSKLQKLCSDEKVIEGIYKLAKKQY